ncbi:MAG TPA: hypothetical protein VNA15_05240 [Candidatus Angelobacter sp.]|nr:hypothetical protein [Candidatus Angelobacter sp.]
MDKLDISILRALRSNPARNPYSSKLSTLREIASEVSVSKDTVKARLDLLTKKGVFGGWQVMLNPSLLSMQLARIWLEFAEESLKREAIERLKTQKMVQRFTDYYGNSLSYVTQFNKTSSLQDQIDSSKSHFSVKSSFGATIMFPDCTMREVTPSDMAIYNAIWNHYNRRLADIAGESGLPIRTVSRRLAKLSESKAIFVIPMINPFAIDGAVCQILVRHSKIQFPRLAQAIMAMGSDCVLFLEPHLESIVVVVMAARNLTRGQEMTRFLQNVKGIDWARLFLVTGTWRSPGPYLNPIDADYSDKAQTSQWQTWRFQYITRQEAIAPRKLIRFDSR